MGLEETPTFEKYEDCSVEGTPDEPPEELEPTLDISIDFFLNVSIVLPTLFTLSEIGKSEE